MARASRTKGVGGELEVRRLYERHGFQVRGLEGAGDHLALGHGLTIFSEAKRQERWKVQEWLRQTWSECPEGASPILAFRGNRWPWVAALPLDSMLGAITREFRTFECEPLTIDRADLAEARRLAEEALRQREQGVHDASIWHASPERFLELVREMERLEADIERQRRREPSNEGGPGREETYWLRAKLQASIRHLRDIEDFYRLRGGFPESHNMVRADRARSLYEQISEDFVNGKLTVPTMRERAERAESELERIRVANPAAEENG